MQKVVVVVLVVVVVVVVLAVVVVVVAAAAVVVVRVVVVVVVAVATEAAQLLRYCNSCPKHSPRTRHRRRIFFLRCTAVIKQVTSIITSYHEIN